MPFSRSNGILRVSLFAWIIAAGGLERIQSCEIPDPLLSQSLVSRNGFGIGIPVLKPTILGVSGADNTSLNALAEPKSGNKKNSEYLLEKVKEWRTAVMQHNPGERDDPAVTVGGWNEKDLDIVIDFVTKLSSKSIGAIKRALKNEKVRNSLELTDREIQQGDLNRLLKMGALLHTDIAMLGLETGEFSDERPPVGVFEDGHVIIRPKMISWELARRLIDSVYPVPSKDPIVRKWYIATTAYLQSHHLLIYAKENLRDALKIFSSDKRIQFYAGALHETWALPVNQTPPLPLQARHSHGSTKSELKHARKYYREAVKENPDFAELHLHLGRVLGLLGDHKKAVAELQKAAGLIKDPQLLYYTALFLGYEFTMLSRRNEALDQYERAAALYPMAQSPLLSISLLARRGHNPEEALQAIQRVFALKVREPWKEDPWWDYDLSHVRNADELVTEMYSLFGEISR